MKKNSATLWQLTDNQRARYGAAIVVLALAHGFLFGIPLVIRFAIDGVLGGSEFAGERWADLLRSWLDADTGAVELLWLCAAAIALLTVVAGLFQYLKGRWAAQASEAITKRTREVLYDHLQHLPCAYFDQADTGDLVQRCTSDVETIRNFLALQVLEIAQVGIMLVLLFPILATLDWSMAIVSVVLFPFIIAFAVVYFRRIGRLFLLVDQAEAGMTTVLQENLTGIRVVRAFARQEFENQKFSEKNALFRDRTNALISALGSYWSKSDLLCMTQTGITLLAGAWWVVAGTLSVGTLVAFMTYQAMVIWPVRQLGRVLTESSKAVVALGRLREILDQPAEESEQGRELGLEGRIEFENVSFSFDSREVLREVSFVVEAGETLALVGPPGCGKSTIVQLLLRLYDYQQGSIRLDGQELADLNRKQVRSQVGFVMQEPFLYSRSIAANLRIGHFHAAHHELVSSAREASIHDPILGFAQGYDTLVGERGVTLSGGQRQRIAIARALLLDPAILVLDDALSAIDTGTERRILESLKKRHGRHTTIVIAHRLSSVRHADRVLVLDEGRIVQDGTHHQLAASPGPYRRLWQLQSHLETDIGDELIEGAIS